MTIGSFNLIKGFAMIEIICEHTMFDYSGISPVILLWLHIFSAGLMPMFFILNGYSLKAKSISKTVKKSSKELLLPFALVALAVAFIYPICHYTAFRWWPGALSETKKSVLPFLVGISAEGQTLFGMTIYDCSATWYFLAMFWGINLTNLILHLKSKKQQTLIAALCVLAGYLLMKVDFWYFCIPQGLMAVGYMYLGHYIKSRKLFEKNAKAPVVAAITVVFVCEAIWGGMNLARGYFKNGLMDYCGAGISGLAILYIGLWANRFENPFTDAIRKIGRFSYWIICVHSVGVRCVPWYLFAGNFVNYPTLGFLCQCVLRAILIAFGCMIICKIQKFIRIRKVRIPRSC